MKTTPVTQIHIDLGAKMADFAGYNMPISYSTITEEHQAVRQNVGLFDVSHMGEFVIRGKQATEFVQKVTSNDVTKLNIGDVQYSCFPNLDGGIVDDLLVYRLTEDMCSEGEQAYMLVVNASNAQKDWNWISTFNDYDCQMIDISERCGLIALQGPKAKTVLAKLTDVNIEDMKYYTFAKGTVAGVENVLVSATGYTGSGGFELYVNNLDTEHIWNELMDAGAEYDIKPCGLGARDTLRLEMGFCLYGHELDDNTSPLEAGLGWITKLNKSDDFNGRDWLTAQKAAGLDRKLVAFTMDERRVPRHGYVIQDLGGNDVGVVTSGTQSPSLDLPIGMGYVPTSMSKVGSKINILVGKKSLEATVTALPFWKV